MARFANTQAPTPFGFFDTDTDFQAEADDIYNYIQKEMAYIFRKTPQVVAKVAPGVTYEQVMTVVEKWLEGF